MCLAIPGKVVEISGKRAVVSYGGLKREVDVSLIDGCSLNDYVLVHVGFAIQKVDEVTARETYRLLSEMDEEAMEKELEKNDE